MSVLLGQSLTCSPQQLQGGDTTKTGAEDH